MEVGTLDERGSWPWCWSEIVSDLGPVTNSLSCFYFISFVAGYVYDIAYTRLFTSYVF